MVETMTTDFTRLAAFGWSNHFQSQLTAEDIESGAPARVLAVHRNGLDVATAEIGARVPLLASADEEGQATVGDWLIVDIARGAPRRLLERKSLFKRRAAGPGRRVQLIAANVDTLLIVTSCNQDFNVARLERYLALAREAEVAPVIVLTKADLSNDIARYQSAALKIMAGVLVECFDARDPKAVAALRPWCALGETVALIGSSGVGKSTLVNTLTGDPSQATAAIRKDDAGTAHNHGPIDASAGRRGLAARHARHA